MATVKRVAAQRYFEIRVGGIDSAGTPYNNRLSLYATMKGAWGRVIEVLQQWASSEGAISQGTEISIVDTRDGGKLFTATYLGFEPNLFDDGSQ